MIRVDVKNTSGQNFSGQFETQAEADAWIAAEGASGDWGKPDRWIGPDALGNYAEDISKALEQRTNTQGQIEYHLGAEFTVTQTDITAQVQQQQAVLTRSQVREACLDIIDQIAAYNSTASVAMDTLFTNPDMIAITLALLTGAPATARAKLITVGPSLYPQAMVDQISAALEALV